MFKIIIIFLLVLSTQVFAQTQKVKLQLLWKNQFQFAGFYIAKELGYYKDAGIDVEIIENSSGINPVELIEDEKVDFAIGRATLLVDKSKGKDIVTLGAIYQHSPLILLVKTDSGIHKIEDLKDKNVMIAADILHSASIQFMLNSHQVRYEDLHLSSNDFNLESFISGNLDAISAYSTNEPFLLNQKNIPYKIFDPKDHGFDFYSDFLFTSSKFIEQNPELTKNFYIASKKGWDYAFKNIEESAEIIFKNYNTQNKSLTHLIEEAKALKEHAYDEYGFMFHIDKEKLHNIIDIYKILGYIHNDVNLDSFIYKHNSDDIYKIKFQHKDIYPFILLFLILFLLLLISVLYYLTNKKFLLTKKILQQEINNKQTEIEKQHSLIIEQAKMTAMGNMLSNIAHQWRQPLNAMSLNISMLEISAKLENKIDEKELFKCIESTSNQIKYLSETIEVFKNFLTPSQQNAQDVQIKDIIENTKSLLKDSLYHDNITLIETIEDATLHLDDANLIQVLLNIINNAKDAINENNLEVNLRYIFIDTTVHENQLRISIKDSAGGIDETLIGKIFDPYFSTKETKQGTGLGLYIVHEMVTNNLNGTIRAKNSTYRFKSHELKGAEFIIKLPILLSEE